MIINCYRATTCFFRHCSYNYTTKNTLKRITEQFRRRNNTKDYISYKLEVW